MSTQNVTQQSITFGKTVKAGFTVGLIAAGINNLWSFIAQALGSIPPPGFPFAVTVSSIFPMVVAATIYFLLVRFAPKGELIFVILSTLFLLVSLYPTFGSQMPDGSPVGEGFTLLTLPMHLITGGLAIVGIPKLSK